MSKQRGRRNFKGKKSVRIVEENLEEPIDNIRALNNTAQASNHKPYMVIVHIYRLQMEIDTAACVLTESVQEMCTKKLKPSHTYNRKDR